MRDRIFLDSNILVYSSLEDNENKHHKVISLLENIKGKEIFLSTQVINEVDDDAIQKVLMEIIETYNISVITTEIIKKAWNLRKQYRYSYWDSLVLASQLWKLIAQPFILKICKVVRLLKIHLGLQTLLKGWKI
uniref:PIN domain-containing protein n=1 Tax=Kuenenia stuttgartiensis TaxID=174633 RepID=Q1PVY2_KUEST|nr:hypothetical protein kustc0638 [Candidatus Kuenenia stuttgartiensis]